MKTKQFETGKGLLDVVIEENEKEEGYEGKIVHLRISLNENSTTNSPCNEYLVALFNHAKELIVKILNREPLPLPSPEVYSKEMEGMEYLWFINPKGAIARYAGDIEEFSDDLIFNDKLNSIEFNLTEDDEDEEVHPHYLREIDLLDYGYKNYEDFFERHRKEEDDRCLSFHRNDSYYYVGSVDDDMFYEINTTLILLYRLLKDFYWGWSVKDSAEFYNQYIKGEE